MILLIVCVSLLTWSLGKCEPPVNSYLPPSNTGGSRPSSQYGPPDRGGGSNPGGNYPGQSGSGSQPQGNYLPPSQSGGTKLGTQHGTLSSENFGQGFPQQSFDSSQGFNEGRGGGRPNSQYGTPNQVNGPSSRLTDSQSSFPGATRDSGIHNAGGSNSRGPNFGQRPDNSYGPPPSSVHSANSPIRSGAYSPNQQPNGQEAASSGPQNGFGGRPGSPSSSYEVAGLDRTGGGSESNFGAGDTDEPAKYQFNYDVDESQTGTKFGHSEQRDGDVAIGEYNVVLPDGRKQVVEYEAGLDGFKPQIRYEGTPKRGNQGGNEGYSGSNNGNGYSGSNLRQPEPLEQYQNANTFTQGGTGYPSGRPGNGRNGQRNGYPSRDSGQGRPGQDYLEDNNGLEELNIDNQGYPRCSNENNGGPQGRGCSASGGGVRGSTHNNDSDEGYPSGRPNGPLGTGY